MSTFHHLTNNQRGDLGIARAIGRFAAMGATVFLPMTDHVPYDLVIDAGTHHGLLRVQVKFTSSRPPSSTMKTGYRVYFNRCINGKKCSVSQDVDAGFDLAFVTDADGHDWLIPRDQMFAKMWLNPDGRASKFLLD